METAILFKERLILELSHILDSNDKSINMTLLFKTLKKEIKNNTRIIEQITKDEFLIKQIRTEQKNLIAFRNESIAHLSQKHLKDKYGNTENNLSPESIEKLIKKLKNILDFYFVTLQITERKTVEWRLKGEEEIGFETGIEDLVSVINKAFGELTFDNEKIQKNC